jgi:hypothetical protein
MGIMPSIVECSSCGTKLKVPANSAAKALRCPKCKSIVPIVMENPKPAPPPVEEEFEVNEAVDDEPEYEVNEAVDDQAALDTDEHETGLDEKPLEEDSALAQLGFTGVVNVFKKGRIPDEAREAIEKTFVKNEKALWAGRPSREMCESKAWIGLVVGPVCILVGAAIGIGMLFIPAGSTVAKLGFVGVGALFFLVFGIVGILAIVFRKRIGGNPEDCFVVTNQRAYIFDGAGKGVRAFTAHQIDDMTCIASRNFDGGGDLIFGYEIHGQEGTLFGEAEKRRHGGQAIGFHNIMQVQLVRQMLFDELIDPQLEKAKKKKQRK